MRSTRKWRTVLAASVLAAAAITGCGSSDDEATTTAGTTTEAAADGGGSAIVEQAKANVTKGMEVPTEVTKPTIPVEVPEGKVIGDVSIIATAPGPAQTDKALGEAAKAVGWKFSVLDGKLTPKGYADADRLFIQQKVDGIIHNVIPDSAVPETLKAAKEAGIPVVCVSCANEVEQPVAAPSAANADQDFKGQGALLADWIIADSDGTAKVAIQNNNGVAAVRARYDGLIERLKACDGCEIVDDQKVSPSGDLIGSGRKTTQALLQKFPKGEVGYLIAPSDSEAVGPGQAIEAAKRDEVKLASYDCNELNLGWIRNDGPQKACVASSLDWMAWAGIDEMARQLTGTESDGQKIPSQLIVAENAPPKGELPMSDLPFREHFLKLWGKQ